MKLFFCKVDGGNFGDDMNMWFWDEAFPAFRDIEPQSTLFGIGSILWRDNFRGHNKIVVMGSGSGYGMIPNEIPPNTMIGWVRGPRTAKLLRLDPSMAITDPAAIVPTFDRFQNISVSEEVVFIPHVGTAKLPLNWARMAESAGVTYLSPAADAESVIRGLGGAKLVLAESLHGAIVADAFRVPWVPMAISPTFNSHKWADWAESLEVGLQVRDCLIPLKKARQGLAAIKSILTSSNPNDVESNLGKPDGTRVAPAFSREDKSLARAWVSRLAPVVEKMLVNDLKTAKKSQGFLSGDTVLSNRQKQIAQRIAEMRDRLKA